MSDNHSETARENAPSKIPCFVCGRELESFGELNQPHGGLALSSHGHYGSRSFDPLNLSYLEINICDSCVEQGKRDGKILLCRDERLLVDSENTVLGREPVSSSEQVWDDSAEREPAERERRVLSAEEVEQLQS